MMVLLRQLQPEEIGISTRFSTDHDQEESKSIRRIIREKLHAVEENLDINIKAQKSMELYNFFIDKNVFKNTIFNNDMDFRYTVWNKLFEESINVNVPGPYNPMVWIPEIKKKLGFLSEIDETGKTKPTDWSY